MNFLCLFICAMLYRAGGSYRFNTKFRDWGCALTVLGYIFINSYADFWMYALSFLLHWAALASYWTWIRKSVNENWANFLLHGFGIGIALLPFYSIFGLIPILTRTVILACLISFWSHLIKDDELEECGRGALIILTLDLLF